jgi:peptidoglycan hydrolase-like protein with peptidoglycan-binding domain
MRALTLLSVAALTAGLCACGGNQTKLVAGPPPPTPEVSPTTASATTKPGKSCNTFYLKHKQGLCETSLGEQLFVVNKDGTVELKGLTAHLAAIEVRKSFSNAADTITANGRFLAFTLTVTNRTRSTQEFSGAGGQDQAILTLAVNPDIHSAVHNFEQSYDAENQIDPEACLTDHKGRLRPGETVTCQIVFDVPTQLVRNLKTGGSNLLIADFGESATVPTRTLGSIRTYR